MNLEILYLAVSVLFLIYLVWQLTTKDHRRGLARLLAFLSAVLVGAGAWYLFQTGRILDILIIAVIVLVYFGLKRFFDSDISPISLTSDQTRYMERMAQKFYLRGRIYESMDDLRRDFEDLFHKMKMGEFRIIVNDDGREMDKYPELIKHFNSRRVWLLSRSIKWKEEKLGREFPYSKELYSLGEGVFPLYNMSSELFGFVILGRKHFDEPYIQGEMEVMNGLLPYLNLLVSSAIYYTDLKKEIALRTRHLKERNKSAREMAEQQADFIAASIHELKTPINVAMLASEKMMSELPGGKTKEELKVVDEAIGRLRNLARRFFEVQQYDLKKVRLDLEETGVRDFIENVCEDFEPLMKEAGLDFWLEMRVKRETNWKIDQLRMREVLQNLLSNAIKFVPRGKKVGLHMVEGINRIRIEVRDEGSGINDEDKEGIFHKFRGHNGGLGLGLYISKKIVKLHGGQMGVEDNPGGGAVFWVELKKIRPEI